MRRASVLALSSALLAIVTATSVQAHNGRGFEVEVVAGKLQAQGINSGDPDGAPAVRPYANSIHDHWRYVPSLDLSVASLPEFEVTPLVASSSLAAYSLDLEWTAAWQWTSPPLMPTPGTIPVLEPLDPGEVISIQTLGAPIDSETLGAIALSAFVPATGTGDIIPSYSIDGDPSDEIHVLEFLLSATPPNGTYPSIATSDPLYVVLSPDGVGPVERLHHASLYIEQYLALNGVPVPEPASMALVWLGAVRLGFRAPMFRRA